MGYMSHWRPYDWREISSRGCLCFVIALTFFTFSACRESPAQSASEYQVKAAYLYNFAKFTKWPESTLPAAASPLVIGVVGGDDEFASATRKTVEGRALGGHPVVVKHLTVDDDIGACQLLFIRASVGRKRTQALVSALGAAAILLVGEGEGFLADGGMINLLEKNGTIRFQVDSASITRANLSLSPELLAHAEGGASNDAEESTRRLRRGVEPEYPEIARRMGLKGAVELEVSIRRDGTVKEVKVIGGHPLLADSLVKAVTQWQYDPGPQESRVKVRYAFGQ